MATTEGPTAAPLTLLEAARRELIGETVAGRAGLAAVDRYTSRIDALLQQVFADAPRAARPVAIIALGGYGRRHLCLHSDVDLLVLFDGPMGPADEQFVRGMFHPLWDLGLMLGHQVRELVELARIETDNPE